MKGRQAVGIAAIGAGLFAGIVMAPALARPSEVLCAYDHPGDAMISIWSTWVRLGAQAGRWSLDRVPLVAYPEGVDLRQNPPEPATEWPQLILARWVGEVAAYNWHLWLTFPLAAATMALFVWELTRLPAAAIVAGLLYACAPYHFAHTMQLSLASIQWLPLGLWSWIRLVRAPTWRRALLHLVCCSLLVWTTAYYGLLFLVASLVVVAWALWRRDSWSHVGKLLLWSSLAMMGAVGVLLVWYQPFWEALQQSPARFAEQWVKPMRHLFVYSAKPWDYLVPSPHHPWVGSWVAPFVRSHLYGSNVVEQTLYLGYGALGLAGGVVVQAWRSPAAAPWRGAVALLALLGGVGLWCSGPPFVPIGPFQITEETIVAQHALYFPSALLHQIVPVFRVYARFGLLVTLAVAGLAGIGWAWARQATAPPARRRGRIGLALLSALLVAEYSVAMPFQSLGSVPPVYAWLADYPHDVVIAEYPMVPSTHSTHAEYLFYQRMHGKRMINGAFERSPAGRDRSALREVTAAGVPEALSALGVALVIIHRDRYLAPSDRPTAMTVLGVTYQVPFRHRPEERPPPPLEIPGLERAAAFGETIIYRVTER